MKRGGTAARGGGRRLEPVILAMLIVATSICDLRSATPSHARARDLGIIVGNLPAGPLNAITDVAGVAVGHRTLIRGEHVRTGVTAILPHTGNLFQEKVPAAVYVGNGFGKLAGSTQIEELGNIETPIVLTSTLNVGTAIDAIVQHTLRQKGNEEVRSVNAVVGETNDGFLNDIRGMHITASDALAAIASARPGKVEEGSAGAGTGTRAFGFKGGIGTASRVIELSAGRTNVVGALVQSNFGGNLTINGAPFWKNHKPGQQRASAEGSCMIVLATDAPLSERNLKRLAQRALHGMARTGANMSNGSGDYVIAFSTAYRIPHVVDGPVHLPPQIHNDEMNPFFEAAMDCTEEAIYNSLFQATTVKGHRGTANAISLDEVTRVCREHRVLAED